MFRGLWESGSLRVHCIQVINHARQLTSRFYSSLAAHATKKQWFLYENQQKSSEIEGDYKIRIPYKLHKEINKYQLLGPKNSN